jgi:hypothetical protein
MSREAVGEALKALEDEAVRGRVAEGDVAALPDSIDLSTEEAEMVVGAAIDYPEVSGFSFSWRASAVGGAAPTMGGLPQGNAQFTGLGRFGDAANYSIGFQLPFGEVM